MNLLGFTAEASLQRTHRRGRTLGLFEPSDRLIRPQQLLQRICDSECLTDCYFDCLDLPLRLRQGCLRGCRRFCCRGGPGPFPF
jgi:hypothetical protein